MRFKDLYELFTTKNKKASFVKLLKTAVSDSLKELHERLQSAIHAAVRSLLLMGLTFLALVFVLVGFSKYLSASVSGLAGGLGYAVVGAGVLVVVLIIHLAYKK
ncbi:MAG: hypothetical protein ACOCU6_01995 [Nanoarchaeota archaeon]